MSDTSNNSKNNKITTNISLNKSTKEYYKNIYDMMDKLDALHEIRQNTPLPTKYVTEIPISTLQNKLDLAINYSNKNKNFNLNSENNTVNLVKSNLEKITFDAKIKSLQNELFEKDKLLALRDEQIKNLCGDFEKSLDKFLENSESKEELLKISKAITERVSKSIAKFTNNALNESTDNIPDDVKNEL